MGWFSIVAIAVFTAFIWFGCGGGGGSGDYSGNYTSISLVWPDRQTQSSDRSLQAIPSDVASLILQVSASDMATIEATIDPLVGQVTLTVPDGSNRLPDEIPGRPVRPAAAHVNGEIAQNLPALGRVDHLRMELDTIAAAFHLPHSRIGRVLRARQGSKPAGNRSIRSP